MFTQKQISILLVLFIITVSANPMPQGGKESVFSDVDITLVAGTGEQVKAAAEKVCGTDLSAEELLRRHGLGEAAELDFFNPRVLDAYFNDKLKQALNCQKNRNKVMKDSCELQWAIKTNNKCEIDDNKKQIADNIAAVDKTCPTADTSLFVKVTDINKPAPRDNEPCGNENGPFTTKFKEVNITKTPGLGTEAKAAAEGVCGPYLSTGELRYRASLGSNANSKTFSPAIKAADYNEPLEKALNCQKARNDIMIAQCTLQRAIIRKKDFNIKYETLEIGTGVNATNKYCDGVNTKLYIDPK